MSVAQTVVTLFPKHSEEQYLCVGMHVCTYLKIFKLTFYTEASKLITLK